MQVFNELLVGLQLLLLEEEEREEEQGRQKGREVESGEGQGEERTLTWMTCGWGEVQDSELDTM